MNYILKRMIGFFLILSCIGCTTSSSTSISSTKNPMITYHKTSKGLEEHYEISNVEDGAEFDITFYEYVDGSWNQQTKVYSFDKTQNLFLHDYESTFDISYGNDNYRYEVNRKCATTDDSSCSNMNENKISGGKEIILFLKYCNSEISQSEILEDFYKFKGEYAFIVTFHLK